MTSERPGLHLIVCDDRPLLLESMIEWLSAQPGVARVTGTPPDSVAAVAAADEGAAALLWTASTAHAQLREFLFSRVGLDDALPVLVVLSDVRPEVALAMFTGAASAVGADIAPVALMAAVRRVASGHVVLPAEVAASALRLAAQQRAERGEHERTLAGLTSREVLILHFLADGVDRAEVARSLSLSPNTVRTHIANLMTKLEAHSQVELAAKARQHLATQTIDTV